MFRRVRSKLVFWLLLVTLGTMIPVAVTPYYQMRKGSLETGRERLLQSGREFRHLIENIKQSIPPAAKIVSQNLEPVLKEDKSLATAFREGDRSRLDALEPQLENNLHGFDAYRGMQVHLLGLRELRELDDYAPPDRGLYETKRGFLLLWVYAAVTVDDITIGGFLVGRPLMRRQGQPSDRPIPESKESPAPLLASTITLEMIVRTYHNVHVEVFDTNTLEIREDEIEETDPLRELLQGKRPDLYTENLTISETPSQALLFPFNNHHGELTGIIALYTPHLPPLQGFMRNYVLNGIMFSVFFAIVVGAFIARSIARPLNRLTKTAKQMARGDFSARVQVSSKDEVGQLAASFNDMATHIERSHTELAARARELEDSIRLLNATNRELTRIQSHLENILANIRSGVIVIDNVGRVIRANRAGQEILGLTDQPNADYREILGYEEFAQMVESSLHKGISVFQREISWNGSENTSVPLQVSVVPLLDGGRITGLVVTFHDLSSIRKLEQQLVLQDRMAALGRLSAGVAHEIRNPLGIIKGSAELLRKRFGGQEGEEGLLDFILEEVARLSRVVSDFLNFARPPMPEFEPVDVNSVIRRSLQYLEHQDRSQHILQEFDLAHNLPALQLDPNLFQQVLLNILLNAQEAIPEGGTIRVRTRRYSSREVAVEVEDSGVGISQDDLQHVFDPFFTSKDTGTGLGLSVVHQIVSSHSGRIEVDSREGSGTTFRLIFPIHRENSNQPRYSSLS
ncbi:MAG: ATP-binding protein [bacterium]